MDEQLKNNEDELEIVDKEINNPRELRLQELDILLEKYEDVAYLEDISDTEYEKYLALKKEFKQLKAELKKEKKSLPHEKTVWDNVPLWFWIYGIAAFLLVTFPINPTLYFYFGEWLVGIFPDAFYTIEWFVVATILIPFLLMVANIVLTVCFRKKNFFKILLIYTIVFALMVIAVSLVVILS